MPPGNKRSGSPRPSKPRKSSKKTHIMTISTAPPASAASTSSASAGSGEVNVHNFTYHTSTSGRLSHRASRRQVTPYPGEGIFAKNLDAPCDDPSATHSADAVLDDFPVEDSHSHPANPAISSMKKRKRRVRSDLKAASKVREWLPFRSDFLDEMLRFEGCEDPVEDGAVPCQECETPGANIRCRDCHTREVLYCKDCILARHQIHLPLHRIEIWEGTRFVRKTLRDLGAVVQLGHKDGTCASPADVTRRVIVADILGVQAVEIRFCECLDEGGDFTREWAQLLRRGWFPATTNRPATAFTFQLLDTFQEMNFQGKVNLYDFWKTIERLTDNSGTGTFNRYKQLSHAVRLWRHLTMLKRFGRGHDPGGPSATNAGGLALECAACPHPGKNLPDGWENAPVDVKWLYTLFLMIDANFRARCKDRNLDNFELASGWSYYVEESRYLAHVNKCAHRKEDNTCSAEHSAITKAHLQREGYVASGIGAVLCARHALVRRNGAGDLQLGERQANMDYLVFSTVLGVVLALLFSYDIACQWYKHLFKRMAEDFPPEMHIDRSKVSEIRFAIPKKHFRVHGPNHSRFSLNYLPRVGRTYGEGIETQWGVMNPLALSTREMSPGMRHEVFNDHWGAWNWQKTTGFAEFFLHALEVAHVMQTYQQRSFNDYSGTFDRKVVREWEAMVQAWERDPSNPDPFEEPTSTISYATAKKELNEQEALEARAGTLPAHDVTPGVFLQLGLEIEDQQRALRARAASGTSVSELAGQQEKRNALMRRIDSWQATQDVHMPVVSSLRDAPSDSLSPGAPTAPTATPKAEDAKLWLPSALPAPLRALASLGGLCRKETRLRLAQLSDSLDDIRRVRRVLAAISDYNKTNVAGSGQRPATRMHNLYTRFRAKERRSVNRYRAARAAMEALDPAGDWGATYRPLLDDDLRGPRKQDDDLDGVAVPSEGRYQISWIWLTPGANRGTQDAAQIASAKEFSISMRAEWARSRARANRWGEEVKLLVEEMRRVITYCKWRATWWREQAGRRSGEVSTALGRGLAVYAEKQASVFDGLAARCGGRWYSYLKTRRAVPEWLQTYAGVAVPYRPRRSLLKGLRDTVAFEIDDAASDSGPDSSEDESDSSNSRFG